MKPTTTKHELVRRWIRRALKGLLAVTLLAAAAGFTYEQVGRWQDGRNALRVGRPVDIGGRSLNISCTGEGSPAVILEAGAGGNAGYDWILAQPGISALTKTCWYDRAGGGWSDPPPGPRTSQSVVNDLHELLKTAAIPPPYVLVGHSIGGDYVRIYASKFPSEVAGMVLVDSSHPDMHEPAMMLSPMSRMSTSKRRFLCAVGPGMAWFGERFGLIRLVLHSTSRPAPEQLSPAQQRVYQAHGMHPMSVLADVEEGCAASNNGALPFEGGSGNPEVDAATRAAGTLGDRPLIVLTAGRYWAPSDAAGAQEMRAFHELWVHQLQAGLAQLSTRGRQIVVENSDHGIPLQAPEAVVEAVKDVLLQVRSGK